MLKRTFGGFEVWELLWQDRHGRRYHSLGIWVPVDSVVYRFVELVDQFKYKERKKKGVYAYGKKLSKTQIGRH